MKKKHQKNAGKHKVAQNRFNTVQKGNNITSRVFWNSVRKFRQNKDPTNSRKNLEKYVEKHFFTRSMQKHGTGD